MAASAEPKTRQLYEFGPFRLDAQKDVLLRQDEIVSIAPKAFQILLLLVRHNNQVVTKDDLMKIIWPDTFVEEANLSRNIFLLRKALGESPQDHHYIVTVPGRGYRFAEDVRLVLDRELTVVAASHSNIELQVEETRPWAWIAAATVLLVVAASVSWKLFHHRAPMLTENDTIVLGEFSNATGDPVFDETLRQGLAVELEQSPFLSLTSDQEIQKTLRLMGWPAGARLTPRVARDVCQRTQSAAFLTGSIARLGKQYVLGLKAESCRTSSLLVQEQETASDKEKILGALHEGARKLRGKLGESLTVVQKFDTPLEQATTPSLEALQAYSLGRKTQAGRNDFAAAIPLYQRAIRLDPNFAMAYAALGSVFWNTGETVQGAQFGKKAYELHAPVSEPERFYIESTYYHYVLGDLDKARQVYEVWSQTYPRNSSSPIRLRQLCFQEGEYEEALIHAREANQLDPSKGGLTFNITVDSLIALNRLQEADTTARQAIANGFDSLGLRGSLYRLAFLENDASGMARQAALIAGDHHHEGQVLAYEAKTAAYYGRLNKSRGLSQRAVESAMRQGQSEQATGFEADAALREALLGRIKQIPPHTTAPLRATPTGREVQYATAWSLAIAGHVSSAQSLADQLARSYPDDTLVRFNYLPVIRAQIALNRRETEKAINLLQAAIPYELSDAWWRILGPVYVRGEAYLVAHRGTEAAAEFRKFLDHRGLVGNAPTAILAHLQLGRAYALMGDNTKARSAYQDFFSLWRDADPDIPVLQQARAEYAKLR
jgi:eukaryotic-like serine/threonine-protein kinase